MFCWFVTWLRPRVRRYSSRQLSVHKIRSTHATVSHILSSPDCKTRFSQNWDEGLWLPKLGSEIYMEIAPIVLESKCPGQITVTCTVNMMSDVDRDQTSNLIIWEGEVGSVGLCKQNKCLFFRGQRWFWTFPPRLAFTCNSKMSDRELTGHLHHLVLRHNNSDVRSVWKLNRFCLFVCVGFFDDLPLYLPQHHSSNSSPSSRIRVMWRRWLVLGSLILFHFVVPRHPTRLPVTTAALLCLFESSFAADYGVNRPPGCFTSD